MVSALPSLSVKAQMYRGRAAYSVPLAFCHIGLEADATVSGQDNTCQMVSVNSSDSASNIIRTYCLGLL